MSPINTILFWVSIAALASGVFFQLSHRPTYHQISGDIWGNIDGYKELRLDSDLYRITYYCNNRDIAAKYALYRAAELTLEKGRDIFIVLDTANQSSMMQYHMEHIAFTTVRMVKAPCALSVANDAKAYLAANSATINR